MKFFARIFLPAVLLGAILTALLQVEPFSGGHPTVDSLMFDVDWKPEEGGIARLFYDTGEGFLPGQSVVAKAAANTRQRSRFLLAPGRIHGFRLVLPNHRGAAEIFALRITNLNGSEVLSLDPSEFWPDEDNDGVEFNDDGALIRNAATLTPEAPLDVQSTSAIDGPQTIVCFFCAVLLIGLLLWKLEGSIAAIRAKTEMLFERAARSGRKAPLKALAATSALAVVVSCHPLLFFGKSLVSPNNRAICLYDDFPTVPESPPGPIEDPKASDIGAMLWSHLPYSIMERRAIFQDGEFPLWDRWNTCGVPLFGQGQSMLGDPLHWITIIANGAPWAWDTKFIFARFLMAFGIGILVLATVEHLGIAALLAASSMFLGFFSYRFNHAACFSLCYAPWILVAWLKIRSAPDWRCAARWACLLAAANWMELNSGAAKEGSMLILCLNFCGALAVLLARSDIAVRGKKLAAAAVGLTLFLLISAPCWLVFLDALRQASTAYDEPHAYQIQPSLLLGLFDDIFYRETTTAELHSNPSANFLLLLGILWAAASARRLAKDRLFLAFAFSSFPPLALAFGLIPPSLILKMPFLGNISHVDNTFSCVLIILAFPLAAFGLRACLDRMNSEEWRGDWVITLLFLGFLALAYFGFSQAISRSGAALLRQKAAMPKTTFFIGYAGALFISLALFPLAARALFLRRRGVMLASAVIVGLALFAMHFRMGMYVATKFDAYVMNPADRMDLAARSPAVEYVKNHLPEPARVTGFDGVLTPGFNAVLGLESPGGSDPLQNKYYREIITAMRFEMLWDWRLVVAKANATLLHPQCDFLNIRYFLAEPAASRESLPGYRLAGAGDLDVYESPTVWPRAFFTDSLGRYKTAANFSQMIWEDGHQPFAAVQEGEEGIPPVSENLAGRHGTPAMDYSVTSNTISFTIDPPSPGVAVLCEGFEKGNFRVTINGSVAPYFRVNHAFKAVYIPRAGHYVIRFAYWPRMLTAALWLSVAGILLFGCSAAIVFTRGTFFRAAPFAA